jgi:hypothetical protein
MSLQLRSQNEKIKYPFFNEIIESNHDFLYKFETGSDFDSYIMLMNLYMYTCKYMYKSNISLSKKSIYTTMQDLYNDRNVRKNLTVMYCNQNNFIDKTLSLMDGQQ